MSVASQKDIVRRYFEEVVDAGRVDILDQLFTDSCIIYRPELAQPIVGIEAFKQALKGILDVYTEFATTIHDLIGEKDRIACRLNHRGVHRGEWITRVGRHAVPGKTVTWDAIAIFRFAEGKVAEEWVSRDELGMMIQLGILK